MNSENEVGDKERESGRRSKSREEGSSSRRKRSKGKKKRMKEAESSPEKSISQPETANNSNSRVSRASSLKSKHKRGSSKSKSKGPKVATSRSKISSKSVRSGHHSKRKGKSADKSASHISRKLSSLSQKGIEADSSDISILKPMTGQRKNLLKEIDREEFTELLQNPNERTQEEFGLNLVNSELSWAIERVLTALYDEPEKPDDPLSYIVYQLGGGLDSPTQVRETQSNIEKLRKEIAQKELENEKLAQELFELECIKAIEDESKKIDTDLESQLAEFRKWKAQLEEFEKDIKDVNDFYHPKKESPVPITKSVSSKL